MNLRNFQKGPYWIMGKGETIDEIQINKEWIKSDLFVDPVSCR